MENKKIKLTNQRMEILDFLKNNTTHPSAEEIYNEVRKKLTRISKATVYQNLNFLVKEGIIKEVNIKGVSRFEPNTLPHHHFICIKCSKIIDFESKELTEFSLKVSKQFKDFDTDFSNTSFYGICNKCKKKKS